MAEQSSRPEPLAGIPPAGTRVVLGLSGGVDSAVAAALLVEAGCELTAVTTRNFCFDDPAFDGPLDAASVARSCCSEEAVAASRELSAQLGIAHHVVDASADFLVEVIDDYVDRYASGNTPSPCVRCNERVRFPALLDFARKTGAECVATGHYARRVRWHDEVFVARGEDRNKDQSYFLYRLGPDRLASMVFPLGDLTKPQVRELARDRGLAVAETPESQELCFVPDGDRSRILASLERPGEIVDTAGKVLGEHRGVAWFTPGQRRGLGLGGGPARVVVELDAIRNRVVVGSEADLGRDLLYIADRIDRDPLHGAPGLICRTRSRHGGLAVSAVGSSGAEDSADELHTVLLEEPDRAPAPGQAVVLDREGVVVGGGRLVKAEDTRS